MKKNFFILFIIFAGFSSVFAQKKFDFDLMLFGGYNSSELFSDIKHKQVLLDKWKHQFHLGVAFRFEFGKYVYLQPEVLYTKKGGYLDILQNNDTLSQNIEYQSINLNILLGGKLVSTEDFNLRLYTGPAIAWLPKGVYNVLKSSMPLNDLNIATSLVSAKFGIGIDIFFITLDFSYEVSTTALFYTQDFSTRNHVIYLTLGIKLL